VSAPARDGGPVGVLPVVHLVPAFELDRPLADRLAATPPTATTAVDAGSAALAVTASGSTVIVYSDPRQGDPAPRQAVSAINPFDQRLWFAVVGRSLDEAGERWYRVLLGTEPNESTGWVRGSDVRTRLVADRIEVDLSGRVLRHWRDGELIHRFKVGIGKPGTPTTPGEFFVWARFPSDPASAYGSYLLGLSGFSEVLTEWPGGGRMAIHGTDDPSDAGRQVSFGCARVANHQMLKLRDVPMGTPVSIVA
jgi:lipoprotein-anchoring transpeptidase ErfK/SrfK